MIRSEFGSLSNWCSFLKRKGHGDLLTRPTSYQSLVEQLQNGVCTFGNCLKPLSTLSRDFIRTQLPETISCTGRVLGLVSSRQRFVRCGQWSDHGNATRRRTKWASDFNQIN